VQVHEWLRAPDGDIRLSLLWSSDGWQEGEVMAKTTIRERILKKEARTLEIVAAVAQFGDWTSSGDYVSLVTAGAERLLKHFVIEFHSWRYNRESWKIAKGEAFAWTYRALVKHNGSQVLAEGRYSNCDPLWREPDYAHPQRDESDIRSGAKHLCVADGVKQVLGLRRVSQKKILDAGLAPSIIVCGKKGGDDNG